MVTPSLRQRLGLVPAPSGRAEQRALLAARSASLLFVFQSGLALTASAIGGTLGLGIVVATAVSLAVAALIFCAYERLPWLVSQLLAFAGVGVAAFLVLSQPTASATPSSSSRR